MLSVLIPALRGDAPEEVIASCQRLGVRPILDLVAIEDAAGWIDRNNDLLGRHPTLGLRLADDSTRVLMALAALARVEPSWTGVLWLVALEAPNGALRRRLQRRLSRGLETWVQGAEFEEEPPWEEALAGSEAPGLAGRVSGLVLLQARSGAAAYLGGLGIAGVALAGAAGVRSLVLAQRLWGAPELGLPEWLRAALPASRGITSLRLPRGRLQLLETDENREQVLELGRTPVEERLRVWRRGLPEKLAQLTPAHVWQGGLGAALVRPGEPLEASLRALRRRSPRKLPWPWAAEAPLARLLGARYPILPEPVSGVIDQPRFARVLAEAGGVPLLAPAAAEAAGAAVGTALEELSEGTRLVLVWPFEAPPPVAPERLRRLALVVPGARWEATAGLRDRGALVWVEPSPERPLSDLLQSGARHFVVRSVEGTGPGHFLPGLVVFEDALRTLHAFTRTSGEEVYLFLGGGIGDRRGAKLLARLVQGSPVHCGLLLGSALLRTPEAVAAGVVNGVYQEALASGSTALLPLGASAVRCLGTPFLRELGRQRAQALQAGQLDDFREAVERGLMTRVRVGLRGVVEGPRGRTLGPEGQFAEGLFLASAEVALTDAPAGGLRALLDELARQALPGTEPSDVVDEPPPAETTLDAIEAYELSGERVATTGTALEPVPAPELEQTEPPEPTAPTPARPTQVQTHAQARRPASATSAPAGGPVSQASAPARDPAAATPAPVRGPAPAVRPVPIRAHRPAPVPAPAPEAPVREGTAPLPAGLRAASSAERGAALVAYLEALRGSLTRHWAAHRAAAAAWFEAEGLPLPELPSLELPGLSFPVAAAPESAPSAGRGAVSGAAAPGSSPVSASPGPGAPAAAPATAPAVASVSEPAPSLDAPLPPPPDEPPPPTERPAERGPEKDGVRVLSPQLSPFPMGPRTGLKPGRWLLCGHDPGLLGELEQRLSELGHRVEHAEGAPSGRVTRVVYFVGPPPRGEDGALDQLAALLRWAGRAPDGMESVVLVGEVGLLTGSSLRPHPLSVLEGLVRGLAAVWPRVDVRFIDLPRGMSGKRRAGWIAEELQRTPGPLVVSYDRAGARSLPRWLPAPRTGMLRLPRRPCSVLLCGHWSAELEALVGQLAGQTRSHFEVLLERAGAAPSALQTLSEEGRAQIHRSPGGDAEQLAAQVAECAGRSPRPGLAFYGWRPRSRGSLSERWRRALGPLEALSGGLGRRLVPVYVMAPATLPADPVAHAVLARLSVEVLAARKRGQRWSLVRIPDGVEPAIGPRICFDAALPSLAVAGPFGRRPTLHGWLEEGPAGLQARVRSLPRTLRASLSGERALYLELALSAAADQRIGASIALEAVPWAGCLQHPLTLTFHHEERGLQGGFFDEEGRRVLASLPIRMVTAPRREEPRAPAEEPVEKLGAAACGADLAGSLVEGELTLYPSGAVTALGAMTSNAPQPPLCDVPRLAAMLDVLETWSRRVRSRPARWRAVRRFSSWGCCPDGPLKMYLALERDGDAEVARMSLCGLDSLPLMELLVELG